MQDLGLGQNDSKVVRNPDFLTYLDAIGRRDLADVVTSHSPWVFFSQELYREAEFGIKGGGGLGVLTGDITRVAEKIGLPLVVVTPFYSVKIRQQLSGFNHGEIIESTDPIGHGFSRIGETTIATATDSRVPLDVYSQQRGSVRVLSMYEPNIGQLYFGAPSCDHRLYQEVVNGFGGYQALKQLDIDPPVLHINEAPAVFAAIAMLDELCQQGYAFDGALERVKNLVIYTNHTLSPAAEGTFSLWQFDHFVMPNIKSADVNQWIRRQFAGNDNIKLSTIAIELSARQSCVSKLHARISDTTYKHLDGQPVKFDSVTNGISDFWIDNGYLNQYHGLGLIDQFGLPSANYERLIAGLDAMTLRRIKSNARTNMNKVLATRRDQYGQPIYIPDDAKLIDFKRRLVSYKRVQMILDDSNRLAELLSSNNAHLVIMGNPHSDDAPMIAELNRMLTVIDGNPNLRQRVHYVQDYDEITGRALSTGSDCSINIPVVGAEACGTSWMKDVANCKVLISTNDGGVADVEPAVYLEVTGNSYAEEADCLYRQIDYAMKILDDDQLLHSQITLQLLAYASTISSARMMRDYLNMRFVRK